MVGARGVVASRFGGIVAQENRTRLSNVLRNGFGVFYRQYQVFGGILIEQRDGVVGCANEYGLAVV